MARSLDVCSFKQKWFSCNFNKFGSFKAKRECATINIFSSFKETQQFYTLVTKLNIGEIPCYSMELHGYIKVILCYTVKLHCNTEEIQRN